jgi:hypothetical protein
MSKKLTPWFHGRTLPARAGWYERDWLDQRIGLSFDYWDGEDWRMNPAGHEWRGSGRSLPWRGLAEKP